ncbi:hypothetical protein AMTRI_Chr01g131030 [Amborella trichopoda]
MVTSVIQPSAITYNILIHGVCKKGLVKDTNKLLDEMVRIGYTPDSMAYTSVIEGHCKNQNLAEAFDLLTKMKQRRVKPYVCGNL